MTGPSPTWRLPGRADFSLTDHVPMRFVVVGFAPFPRDKFAGLLPAVCRTSRTPPLLWSKRRTSMVAQMVPFERRACPRASRPQVARTGSGHVCGTVPWGCAIATNIRYSQIPLFRVASVAARPLAPGPVGHPSSANGCTASRSQMVLLHIGFVDKHPIRCWGTSVLHCSQSGTCGAPTGPRRSGGGTKGRFGLVPLGRLRGSRSPFPVLFAQTACMAEEWTRNPRKGAAICACGTLSDKRRINLNTTICGYRSRCANVTVCGMAADSMHGIECANTTI